MLLIHFSAEPLQTGQKWTAELKRRMQSFTHKSIIQIVDELRVVQFIVIVTMSTARLLLMYLTYIVSCGRTYYTSQTLTRPVVIVMHCLASIWLLANLGPLLRMLPERGAGLGLGSNYGLRCLWLGREIRTIRRRRRLNAAERLQRRPPSRRRRAYLTTSVRDSNASRQPSGVSAAGSVAGSSQSGRIHKSAQS